MTKLLDIDQPKDAREYIVYAAELLLPGRPIKKVMFGSGEVIHFNNMTDEQAVRVARSLYLDIELPAAAKARKQ